MGTFDFGFNRWSAMLRAGLSGLRQLVYPMKTDSQRETFKGPTRRPKRGLRAVFGSWLLPWHERRHAVRASAAMLTLFHAIRADHPDWGDRELFKRVVMARAGCNSMAAEAVLKCAEESFAQWPVSRELTLCDVVHYVLVTEFLAGHEEAIGIHSDMARVVASRLPRELCVPRRKA